MSICTYGNANMRATMNDHDFDRGTQSKCQNSSSTYDLNTAVVEEILYKITCQSKPDLFFSSA